MTSKSSCSINLLKEERAYSRRRTAPALLHLKVKLQFTAQTVNPIIIV